MEDLTSTMMEFVRSHSEWAVVILGLTAFGESLFLVGLLFPATPVLLAIGGLVAAGAVEPAPLLVAAVVGAVTGDIVSYLIGRKSGRRITYSPMGKRYRTNIAKARVFFRKYGMMSVFLGRFFGPLRATVPFVAGMSRMGQARFQIANVASAVVWAPIMLLPGWIAIKGYDLL
jgi:membrane protein DedA with SNARE-associated domain